MTSIAVNPPFAMFALPGVKSIIAIASGKGGVGKSTVAVNLALALRDQDLKIGLLDADIYGPSIPRMLGLNSKPPLNDHQKMLPLEKLGIKCMSMGFLVPEESPVIWRGPMVQKALRQMLEGVEWGELDVLVVDMPPGTGDAQLTLAQRTPLTGVVIVSTPQDIALLDARKAFNMFLKVGVPVLGFIENMSYFNCPACGHRSEVFHHGGAKAAAALLGVSFLGEIPLEQEIRETCDRGLPIVEVKSDGKIAEIYRKIASYLKQQLSS